MVVLDWLQLPIFEQGGVLNLGSIPPHTVYNELESAGGTVASHTQACLDGRWGTREQFSS
ncbi:hypothetical protein INR49_009757 [Caranx melampygus]|nr:hypothetical protein INR49_009757 [Caranx melampygus]